MSRPRISYPTKAIIKRAIDAARAAGVKVGGVEMLRDGTIRVLTEAANNHSSAYDRWQEGRSGKAQ